MFVICFWLAWTKSSRHMFEFDSKPFLVFQELSNKCLRMVVELVGWSIMTSLLHFLKHWIRNLTVEMHKFPPKHWFVKRKLWLFCCWWWSWSDDSKFKLLTIAMAERSSNALFVNSLIDSLFCCFKASNLWLCVEDILLTNNIHFLM